MRRLLATLLTASTLMILAGCAKPYENRVNLTLQRMEYLQRLDQYLQPPVGDEFQQLGIYVRPPKPLTRASAPGLTPRNPEEFDVLATLLDTTSAAPEPGGAPPAALRLHTVARAKQAQAAAAEGEDAPLPYEREDFLTAVLDLLASNLGGIDPVEAIRQPDKKRLNDFQRVVFNAANDDLVRVYFYKQADYELALIWVIPPSLEKTPVATSAAELTLESLSVGPRAVAAFQGIDEEDGIIPADGAAPIETGVAF